MVRPFAKDWGSKVGVSVSVDHIDNAQIPTRIAAEIQAGQGHDLIQCIAPCPSSSRASTTSRTSPTRLVYPTITIPVSVWLLIGFLKAIPRDVEEQAMVDGYSRLAAFVRVVLPLAFPEIVAVVVFAFTLTASEFIYALAFVSPTAEKVVSTGCPPS